MPYYAELFIDRFIDRFIEAPDKLEEHPRNGRRVPEADQRDDIRELIVQGYRIIYRVGTEDIRILTVIHGSRDLAGQEGTVWD